MLKLAYIECIKLGFKKAIESNLFVEQNHKIVTEGFTTCATSHIIK